MNNRTAWAILLGSILCAQANAQTKIPAEDFAKHPKYQSAELSPGGDYVAVATPVEDRTSLAIIRLSGNFETKVMRFGPKELVNDIWWADDTRVVIDKAIQTGAFAQPRLSGEVMSTDVDAKNQELLFGYQEDNGNFRGRRKDEGFTYVVGALPHEPGEMLAYFQPWGRNASDASSALFRVDAHTGIRQEIARVPYSASFVADNNGAPRFVVGQDEHSEPILKYRRQAADQGWEPLPKAIAGRRIWPIYFEEDNNTVYAKVSDAGEPYALYKIDLAKGTREKLAGNPDLDVSTVLTGGFKGKPFAVMYDGGGPSLQYTDPTSEWAQLHAGLMKQFPGQLVMFTSFARDDRKVAFFVYSDRNPGTYYLYDRNKKELSRLFDTHPWIKPDQMARTKPIHFQGRDGTKLYGLLTTPQGAQGPQPLVVVAHGGPYGIYDSWGFDPDVQFLANRGYSVLQVNFRASGGRGENFETAGYQQWGKGIQDDISDGVKWVIAQKLVDPNRICIYGVSFGGYAALMNPVRNPGLYRCTIGYAGPYDLALKYKAGDTNDSRQGRNYLERALGKDMAALDEQSPAKQVDKLKLPILLIHGKEDWRVPMDQYKALANALDAKGVPFESLVKTGEGHGFYKVENRAEVYSRMEAFLDKHIGPNAK